MAKKLGKPRKQFCVHGHDTFICGRNKQNMCNDCKKQWNKDNGEYQKQYRKEHREEILAYMKDWWKNNTEHMKEYHQENREKRAAQSKEWKEKHPDLALELMRQWREAHKEEIAEYLKQWLNENPEYHKQWRKEHPKVVKANNIKQQTNRNLRVVAWTDWDNINKIIKKCPKMKTVDHYIPLQGDGVSGLHVS